MEVMILEDSPLFNVMQEYQEEFDYYCLNNPVHPPEPGVLTRIAKLANGARGVAGDIVKFRDELYGYDKPDDGKPHLHLKPVDEMKFLPDGMGSSGDSGRGSKSSFGFNATPPDMNLHLRPNEPEWQSRDFISHRKLHPKKKCSKSCKKCHGCDETSHRKKPEKKPDLMDPTYIPDSLRKLF